MAFIREENHRSKFECGGHRCAYSFFPFGNSNGQPTIWFRSTSTMPIPRAVLGMACLRTVCARQLKSTRSYHLLHQSGASTLHCRGMDWGFTRFNELRKLAVPTDVAADPSSRTTAPMSLPTSVFSGPNRCSLAQLHQLRLQERDWLCRSQDQGATCYMNRSSSPTSAHTTSASCLPNTHRSDIPSESVALALQRVFYLLQTSDQPVGTNELTKSFGWKSLDSFLQHDVQESTESCRKSSRPR